VSAPAHAHFPVNLNASHSKVSKSPILIDGTISFAVYADFAKAKDQRHVRFALKPGEELNVEYLILDAAPTNKLKKSQLPSVLLTTPSGEKISLPIKERTPFFEPYGKKSYFYLARLSQRGEAGIYSISATAKVRSSIVLAVGRTETRGDFLNVGSSQGQCPATLKSEEEITDIRATQLIGMKERGAEVCAAANKWFYRVGERDGEPFAVTMDYRSNRVTVTITSGRITAVSVG
jgi:hypothetical protein